VEAVVHRPVISALGAAAVLLILAGPVTHLRLGNSDVTSFPESIDGVQAIEVLQAHWPAGTILSLDVVVTDAKAPATQAAIARLQQAGQSVAGLSGPATVTPSGDGTVALVSFVMSGTENDPANWQAVRDMRTTVVPQALAQAPGAAAYVTGNAAVSLDQTQVFTDGMVKIFVFVLGLSFLLLLVVFRSLVIPLKAIVLNLLSTGAAYGVLVLVFQDGFLGGPLGVRPSEVIQNWVPVFVFTILFGLSMDYEVFILTRVKEWHDGGLDTHRAVARGIAMTAGTVTSAAAIMVVVFAVFVTLRLVIIRELGLGLAVAVFLDATVIRAILLPASMRLLGEWNWYLPKFLNWLPRVQLEVEDDRPREEPVPA
jgi:RND superfamily putative drug exporter